MNRLILSIANNIAGVFQAAPHTRGNEDPMKNYGEYLKNTAPSEEELSAHRDHIMHRMPLISVIMPADGAHPRDLTDSIESIAAQTYRNVEVCVVSSPEANRLPKELSRYEFVHLYMTDKGVRAMIESAVQKCTGEYLLFMLPGDVLQQDAMYKAVLSINKCASIPDALYMDNDCFSDGVRKDPHLAPEFSRDTICSYDYIGNGFLVTKVLYGIAGGLNSFSADDLYDLRLRTTTMGEQIVHIAYIGYTYKGTRPTLTQAKTRSALDMHIKRKKRKGHAVSGLYDGSFRLHYVIPKKTDTEIIVACYGDTDKLRLCLEQIEDCSTYENYRITVADMGVHDARMVRYLNALKNSNAANVKSFPPNTPRAKAFNECSRESYAQSIAFLDYRVRVLSPDWLESMLEYAMLDDTGAVGAKLITPDSRIVHAGYVIGMCGWWQSPYFGEQDVYSTELQNRYVNTIRNVTAVSDMCMMISSQAFHDIGGFDESFTHSGEDVDLCIRLLHKRYHNVYTPFVRAQFRDDEYTGPMVSEKDMTRCYDALRDMLAHGDPCYNPAYDYASTKPEIAINPSPAIRLNPNYNS